MENLVHLDTHVVVWLYDGKSELIPDKIKSLLNKNDLIISPIVKLELQYLYEIKRLNDEANIVISLLQDEIGLRISETQFNKIIEYSLKNSWTRDPFDRIIVAQAELEKAQLVTKDETIHKNYKNAVW